MINQLFFNISLIMNVSENVIIRNSIITMKHYHVLKKILVNKLLTQLISNYNITNNLLINVSKSVKTNGGQSMKDKSNVLKLKYAVQNYMLIMKIKNVLLQLDVKTS